jgi:thiol-disulfide isomerase/thioredoxin
MSKAGRIREQNVRERVAAQRAAAASKERRRRVIVAGSSLLAVVAVVAGFLVVRTLAASPSARAAPGGVHGTALPASAASDIASVPAATLASVGAGSVPSYQNQTYAGPALTKVSGTPLMSGGKPEMLYIGAEYCPFCAAMRWSMAVALSRFGTFTTPLRGIHSAADDVDPDTPTLTFYGARYRSRYLAFVPVENENLNRQPLQTTTASEQALWQKFDSADGELSFPFVDFGNKFVLTAPLYNPAILKGMTWEAVAAALRDPSSAVARAIDGTANYMTAAICRMTGDKPASVCNAPSVRALESGL